MNHKRQRLLALALAWVCAGTLASCGGEEEWDDGYDGDDLDQTAQEIIGGKSQSKYPAVGYLRFSTSGRYCTGTLIRSDVVLTSAHCVTNGRGLFKDVRDAFFARGSWNSPVQTVPVVKTVANANFDEQDTIGSAMYDLALLFLAAPVTGVKPASLIDLGAVPIESTCSFQLFGYGETKRKAHVPERKSLKMCLVDSDKAILTAFSPNGGPCHGDSGGPLFRKGTRQIIGIHSRSGSKDCTPGDHAKFTSIETNRRFLKKWLSDK